MCVGLISFCLNCLCKIVVFDDVCCGLVLFCYDGFQESYMIWLCWLMVVIYGQVVVFSNVLSMLLECWIMVVLVVNVSILLWVVSRLVNGVVGFWGVVFMMDCILLVGVVFCSICRCVVLGVFRLVMLCVVICMFCWVVCMLLFVIVRILFIWMYFGLFCVVFYC